MSVDLTHALAKTPLPGYTWANTPSENRASACQAALESAGYPLKVVAAELPGIIVAFNGMVSIAADLRGRILLDAEEYLKKFVEPSITVYLRAAQDRNAARKFRGVKVLG